MIASMLDCPAIEAFDVQPRSRVVELRQYTLHPGRRDALIELFEREFVETQEAVGIELIGQFRDLDAPDRFVWLRGFPDMESRARALGAFYGGPAWKANRDAANATMIDSDDVLLLRPSHSRSAFAAPGYQVRSAAPDTGVILVTIHTLDARDPSDFIEFFERVWTPMLWNASVAVCGSFVTEWSSNTFPALPVRENESVFVWFSSHASVERASQAQARIQEALDWSPRIGDEMARHLARPTRVLRLQPTLRSRLR
jgi:hypothetical protein